MNPFGAPIRKWLRLWRMPRPRLEATDASFYELVEARSQISRVATGFRFTEGPVWAPSMSGLLFSDIPASRIYLLRNGRIILFREASRRSNGLTLDAQGRLIACEQEGRRVSRTEPDGSLAILADSYRGKPLNSPNDVVVRSDGSIYFTDPPYGIWTEMQEQPVQGVYRIDPSGRVDLVADDFDRPNGLAFSPDERQLYIDDSSERRHVRVFDVASDGSLSRGRVFVDMNVSEEGVPDGMKVDVLGNIFCTGPGGVWVISPDGRRLGTVRTPEPPSNCAWGGEHRRTLFITARSSVYAVNVRVGGNLPE